MFSLLLNLPLYLGQSGSPASVPSVPLQVVETSQMVSEPLTGFQIALAGLYVLISLTLLSLVLGRPGNNDALGGAIMGGGADSGGGSYQGKKTLEDGMTTVTNGIAASFLILSLFLPYIFSR